MKQDLAREVPAEFRPARVWEFLVIPWTLGGIWLGSRLNPDPTSSAYSLFFAMVGALVSLIAFMPRSPSPRPSWGRFTLVGSRRHRLASFSGVAVLYLGFDAYKRFMGVGSEQWVLNWASLTNWRQWTAFLVTVLIVSPVAEELFFRGALFCLCRRLDNRFYDYLAVLAPSAMFVLVHSQYSQPSSLFYLLLLSLLLAVARVASGSILLPILMHVEAGALALLFEVVPTVLASR